MLFDAHLNETITCSAFNSVILRNLIEATHLDDMYTGSRFEAIRRISTPGGKGKYCALLAIEIMTDLVNPTIRKRINKGHDVILDGHKVEIKSSTCWGDEIDNFGFQQIRPDDDFDRIVFLGINPNSIRLWWATKDDIKRFVAYDRKKRQHGGEEGKQELYWEQITCDSVPHYFRDISTWNIE